MPADSPARFTVPDHLLNEVPTRAPLSARKECTDSMLLDGAELSGPETNPIVAGQQNPLVSADSREPVDVLRVRLGSCKCVTSSPKAAIPLASFGLRLLSTKNFMLRRGPAQTRRRVEPPPAADRARPRRAGYCVPRPRRDRRRWLSGLLVPRLSARRTPHSDPRPRTCPCRVGTTVLTRP